jgi:integrase
MSIQHQIDIIRSILNGGSEGMPRRYQQGKLLIRRDVSRPYYFIRVSVPRIDSTGKRVLTRESKNLGFVDDTPKKEAMRRRSELLDAVNAGRIFTQSQIKFKDVAGRFIEVRVPQLGVAAQSKYKTQVRLHILPAFGEMKMCDIDRPAVEAWLNAKERAGLSWWTRIDLKGVLSAIFTTAKGWKLWEGDNPTEGVRIGRKKEVREKRILSSEDLRRLLAALSDQVRFMVMVMFLTGLRVSEVLGLRWKDIDLDAGTLTVNQRWYRGDLDEPKTENSRRTRQMGPLASEFRSKYPGPHKLEAFVFLGDDERTPPDERDLLRYELRPVLKKLKLYYPGFGWHAFRRQNISGRQTAGATPIEAQKAAGHGSLDMTMLYTIVDAGREKEQVGRMVDWLMEGEMT